MGELAEVNMEIIKHPSANAPDIHLRSRGTEWIEKAPRWRSLAKDYRIDSVYFYGNHKKYIIVFIKINFEPEKGIEEKRYMCVTGEISRIWKM